MCNSQSVVDGAPLIIAQGSSASETSTRPKTASGVYRRNRA